MKPPAADRSPQRRVVGQWGACTVPHWADGGCPRYVAEIAHRVLDRIPMDRWVGGMRQTAGVSVGWHVSTGWFVAVFRDGNDQPGTKVWSEK